MTIAFDCNTHVDDEEQNWDQESRKKSKSKSGSRTKTKDQDQNSRIKSAITKALSNKRTFCAHNWVTFPGQFFFPAICWIGFLEMKSNCQTVVDDDDDDCSGK